MNIIQKPVFNSDDISEYLTLALENLQYENELIVRYSFLIEEALLKWKDSGLSRQELTFSRSDNKKNVVFEWSVTGEKTDPFYIDPTTSETDCITRMNDLLLSGVGNEIKYRYKKGVNTITLRLPKTNHTESLFKRNLLLLSIPLALQALMAAIATFVDSFMVGFLDVNAMSAVSQLSQYIMTHSLLVMVCETTSIVVITQLWGKRDREQMRYASSIALQVALLISALFWGLAFFAPRTVMSFYTNVPELMPYGVAYLKAISVSFFITAAYRIYYCLMRIIGRTKDTLVYSVYGCLLNIICNALFIFGLFGAPKLGAYGAALSTILSALFQLILVLRLSHKDKNLSISLLFTRYKSPAVKKFIDNFIPIAIQVIVWGIANNIVAAAFGHMDADIIAANSILVIIFSLIMCTSKGISSAGAILIGDIMGKKQKDKAWLCSKIFMKCTSKVSLAAILLVAILALAYTLLPMNMSDTSIRYIYALIFIYGINIFFGFKNASINSGMLYNGGEAKKILLIDAIVMWGVMVPVSLASTYWISIPSLLLLFILKLDETLSFPYKYHRYRIKVWMKKMDAAD